MLDIVKELMLPYSTLDGDSVMPNKRADNKRHVDFWLDVEVYEKIKAIAKDRGCSKSDILVELASLLVKKENKEEENAK